MNRNQNIKTLDERKQELASLKTEWEAMKKQEKELKEKFYSSPFEQRVPIKRELKSLQDAIFEKKDYGTNIKIDIEREESLQKRANPVGNPTDPQHLAELIKTDLQDIINNDKRWRKEGYNFDYMEIAKGEEIWVMNKDNKELKKAVENLLRHRNSKEMYANDIKPSDLDPADYNEILNLVRQISELGEVKRKQQQSEVENMKINNSRIFTQSKCSTDGKYNGRGKWENWHTFSGKHNGHNYTIYVPNNHLALTNVLFDDGWGTNSEVGKFFVVEGATEPTTLQYWNVEKQRNEVISEAEAQRLESQGKDWYIEYKTYVDLNDKITIDHYQENGQQDLAKPVSGENNLVENSNQQNMSGGVIKQEKVKSPEQVDNEFLLQYFKDHDIKQISLNPEGNLVVEYNSGKSETIFNKQANNQELGKLITYYQKNGQTNLSQQDLINMTNSNSVPIKTTSADNTLLISCGIGLTLVVGIGIGLLFFKKKNSQKKY